MKEIIKFRNFYVKPKLPSNLEPLSELSQNLWSTWDPEAYRLFSRIDPILFRKFNHNPVKLLQNIPDKRLEELSQEKGFLYEMKSVYKKFKSYLDFTGYYMDDNGKRQEFDNKFQVAYFCMEFGLHESLPIYSGGLGILSGDHLKAASDLGLPLIGFGLLYRLGYFFQKINFDGMQEEIYEENEWYSKPIIKLKDNNGKDLTIKIKIRGENLYIKAWQINVGKIPLYLLDTNLEVNKPHHRKITDYLYDADRDTRILQEIVLAFGSLELMKKLKIEPTLYHLNEGHSAFLIIKRLNNLINKKNFCFEEAVEIIRASTVFTTHTPVPAGNEKFNNKLVQHYLVNEFKALNMDFTEFSKYATVEGDENFSLSALAIRFSCYINGVSRLHSKISKQMWHSIYPELYEDEMPIKAITNGVHIQSWLSRSITRLFDRYIGVDYQHKAEDKSIWQNVMSIPDNEVWEAHQARKEQMITFIRKRLKASLLHKGSSDSITKLSNVLNLDYLIVGFARRFASYKRANLILHDKERLLKLIKNEKKPVQFLFAGKAHPADEKGKSMIKEIIDFARENQIEDSFVFVENYDMNIARHLVQGVDVWLNNPIKPMEASGTSGMKAGMNGVLNLSILDGWWSECYNVQNGWKLNSGENIANSEIRDRLEANEIYDLLENEIIPLYYDQDQNGLPMDWIEKMKYSIYDVGKGFNIHRMLREYINEFYLPGAENVKQLADNNFQNLHEIMNIKNQVKNLWDKIKIIDFQVNIYEKKIVNSGEQLIFKAKVDINDSPEDLVQVEVFYKLNETNYQVIPLEFQHKESDNIAIYEGIHTITGAGKQGFNVRIRPRACFSKTFYNHIKWFYT